MASPAVTGRLPLRQRIQGRLSGPASPDNADELPLGDIERHIAEGGVAVGKGLGESLNVYGGHRA